MLQGALHAYQVRPSPRVLPRSTLHSHSLLVLSRARHISISTGQQSATRKRSASAQEVFLSTICCREIEARHCWPVENLQVHHPYHQQTKFSQCVPHAHDRTVVTDTSHMSNDFHRLCAPRKSITSAGTNVRGVVSIMPRLMCRLLGTVLSLERMCGMLLLPLLISRQKHIKSFTSFFFLFRDLPQDDALNSHSHFNLRLSLSGHQIS